MSRRSGRGSGKVDSMKRRHALFCAGAALAGLVATSLDLAAQQATGKGMNPIGPPPASMTEGDEGRFDPGAPMHVKADDLLNIDGKLTRVKKVEPSAGYTLPDGRGGYVWIGPNNPIADPNPNHQAAIELKLKVRELAEQLFSGVNDPNLRGTIAAPTSFVNQDDFEESSSLGRYIAEQMFHECAMRGFPVREYRLRGKPDLREREGEFVLSRPQAEGDARTRNAVVLVGTYYGDKENVFINARLVRSTGQVMRTGSVMIKQSQVTKRMLAKTGKRPESAGLGVRDFKQTLKPGNLGPIDRGEDIH